MIALDFVVDQMGELFQCPRTNLSKVQFIIWSGWSHSWVSAQLRERVLERINEIQGYMLWRISFVETNDLFFVLYSKATWNKFFSDHLFAKVRLTRARSSSKCVGFSGSQRGEFFPARSCSRSQVLYSVVLKPLELFEPLRWAFSLGCSESDRMCDIGIGSNER